MRLANCGGSTQAAIRGEIQRLDESCFARGCAPFPGGGDGGAQMRSGQHHGFGPRQQRLTQATHCMRPSTHGVCGKRIDERHVNIWTMFENTSRRRGERTVGARIAGGKISAEWIGTHGQFSCSERSSQPGALLLHDHGFV